MIVGSSKYFQAKALVTFGMIVLVIVKMGNILFETTESVFVNYVYFFIIISAIFL